MGISANQFQLVPDIAGALGRGVAAGQQFRLGQQKIKAQEQAIASEESRARVREQAGQFSREALAGREGALESVAAVDPQKALSIQEFLATKGEAEREEFRRENEAMTKAALIAKQLPREQVRPFLESQRDRARAAGRSTERTDRALSGTDEELFRDIEFQSREGQEIESMAKALFGEKEESTPTTLERNLRAAGLTPGTPEFQAAALRAVQKPATRIEIGGEKKFQEKLAEGQAKTVGRISEEADAAIDANQSLAVLEAIDVDTGALEPAKQGLAAFAQAFGLDASGIANVAKGEAFNAEAKRLVLAVKATQKGPQTDKDEITIRKTVADLGNTRAGNQFIIDSARALNNRKIERKEFYDRFIEEAGGNFKDETGKTADRAWAEFKRSTPMISTNLRTPEGLPVFFYRFEEAVRNANPEATRGEILQAWKDANRG